jgi:hypothetical protein
MFHHTKGSTRISFSGLVIAAALISNVCAARDVTDAEREEISAAVRQLVAPNDRVLKLHAYWSDLGGSQELGAMVTTRPLEVGEGLCVAESYILRRREGESTLGFLNEGRPISRYWDQDDSCDVIDPDRINEFGVIPDTVSVSQPIATTHVARIIRGANEILSLATPDLWCNERIMPTLFQPNVDLRLTRIELDRPNVRGAGIRYTAWYTRQGKNDDGVTIRFAMLEGRFEVSRVCYWIA